MLTEQHIAESLSRVCVQAIAATARLNITFPMFDYGVDGIFHQLRTRNNRRFESGFHLCYQLKASTQWEQDDKTNVYDLESKNYNDLVSRTTSSGAIPCILLLLTLPPDLAQWLDCSEKSIAIRGGGYWACLEGKPTKNCRSVRIRIPRQQQLNPESLSKLFDRLEAGEWWL